MSFQSFSLVRKYSSRLLAVLLFALFANVASAASAQATVGAGTLDDWLALGLAMLAALYCVQKRE